MDTCEQISKIYNKDLNCNDWKEQICGKNATYICAYCNKHFCINDMYLMCKKCHMYVTCHACGILHKKIAVNYCIDVDHICKNNIE